jgi:hypothetical protein
LDFGNRRDNLSGALIIFMQSFPDQDEAAAAKEISNMLHQHIETNVQVTVAELTMLSKGQSTRMPNNYEQLRNILVGYHRFQQVLLGDRHDVPREFRAFVDDLRYVQTPLEKRCQNNPHACAQVLCFVQLATWPWVMAQEKTDVIIGRISSDIMLGQWPTPDFSPGFEAKLLQSNRLQQALGQVRRHPQLARPQWKRRAGSRVTK